MEGREAGVNWKETMMALALVPSLSARDASRHVVGSQPADASREIGRLTLPVRTRLISQLN